MTRDRIKDIPSRQFASIADILDDIGKHLDQFAVDEIDVDASLTHWMTEVRTNVDTMEQAWLTELRKGEDQATKAAIQKRIEGLGAKIEDVKDSYTANDATLLSLANRLQEIDKARALA